MNKVENLLKTENLNFIGAGKLMYNDFFEDFNIPHLHFLVIEHSKNEYEAVNLELQLFASGKTPKNAIAELAALTTSHIFTVIKKGRGYTELAETAEEITMANYWSEYRKIEFKAAEQKKDIGHNVESRINNVIKEIIGERIKELIKEYFGFIEDKFEELSEFFDYNKGVPSVLYQEAA